MGVPPTCLDNNSLQRVYRLINLRANTRASMKPSATNMISQISSKSGITMAHGLWGPVQPRGNETGQGEVKYEIIFKIIL